MSRFYLSRAAEDDLESVWNFIGIEGDNPRAAARLIDRIIEVVDLLAAQPLLGELRGDFADVAPDIRSFSVGNYVIFYRPTPGGVRVGRILHGARDAQSELRRRPE